MPSGSEPAAGAGPGAGPGVGGAEAVTDLFIIGGGVNGCAIARDAAGRGLSVRLAEAGDLAQATSSATTKLIHGGLRYLEYLDLRLVREALAEREVLLAMMPHLARPLRFVLPVDPAARYEDGTPVGRALARLAPWLRGRRPAALLRAGLFLYDHVGGRRRLPATQRLDLTHASEGAVLRAGLRLAYEYSDVQVDDARLVVALARDASARGARIETRAQVAEAREVAGLWHITLRDGRSFAARALVNAAGPWAAHVIRAIAGQPARGGVRMVRGSHLVTRRLHPHDKAYLLQGSDGRIVFLTPFEGDFTLIGTTDVDQQADPATAACSEAERDYLLACANRWLRTPITEADVVWTFSGVRGLFDDGAGSASAASRDYVLEMAPSGAPCLSVFGGKLTTHRRLAESVLARLLPALGRGDAPDWTAGAPLPGGDFPVDGLPALMQAAAADFPWLDAGQVRRMARAYGTELWAMLGGIADPGADFGAGLREVELDWMARREWARSAEDALFRRSKLGLHLDAGQRAAVARWFDPDAPAMR